MRDLWSSRFVVRFRNWTTDSVVPSADRPPSKRGWSIPSRLRRVAVSNRLARSSRNARISSSAFCGAWVAGCSRSHFSLTG